MYRFLFLALPLAAACGYAADNRGPITVSDEARRIHAAAIVFDGHNDLPWQFREKKDGSSFIKLDISRPQKKLHTDIPRLRRAASGPSSGRAYVPAETDKRAHGRHARRSNRSTSSIAWSSPIPTTFETGPHRRRHRAHSQGRQDRLADRRRGRPLHRQLARRAADVSTRLGVRYMTLTHTDTLDWADSATDKPKHHGLTPFGEQVVARDESAGHAGGHLARLGRHDAARAEGDARRR